MTDHDRARLYHAFACAMAGTIPQPRNARQIARDRARLHGPEIKWEEGDDVYDEDCYAIDNEHGDQVYMR